MIWESRCQVTVTLLKLQCKVSVMLWRSQNYLEVSCSPVLFIHVGIEYLLFRSASQQWGMGRDANRGLRIVDTNTGLSMEGGVLFPSSVG